MNLILLHIEIYSWTVQTTAFALFFDTISNVHDILNVLLNVQKACVKPFLLVYTSVLRKRNAT